MPSCLSAGTFLGFLTPPFCVHPFTTFQKQNTHTGTYVGFFTPPSVFTRVMAGTSLPVIVDAGVCVCVCVWLLIRVCLHEDGARLVWLFECVCASHTCHGRDQPAGDCGCRCPYTCVRTCYVCKLPDLLVVCVSYSLLCVSVARSACCVCQLQLVACASCQICLLRVSITACCACQLPDCQLPDALTLNHLCHTHSQAILRGMAARLEDTRLSPLQTIFSPLLIPMIIVSGNPAGMAALLEDARSLLALWAAWLYHDNRLSNAGQWPEYARP